MCFRENKRWQQCELVYHRTQESGVPLSLQTIMRSMLRPDDIVNIQKRIQQKKV